MRRAFLTLAAAPAIVLSIPAAAHHSAAMYDFTKPQTRSGVVKEIQVINPHSHMRMTIAGAKGTRDWDFEGHSASNFYRGGYTRGSVNPGDKITITYAPLRDGKEGGGYIVSFTTAAGTKVGFGSP